MELILSDKEKIYYTHDYCKGKSNITITDKRLISTIKSKRKFSKHEFLIDDIYSVKMKFNPDISLFILSGIILLTGIIVMVLMLKGKTLSENKEQIQISILYMGVFIFLAIIYFIIGLIKLKNAYSVIIKTKAKCYIKVLSISSNLGKVKPISLKPSKEDAFILMNDIPSTIALIKREKTK